MATLRTQIVDIYETMLQMLNAFVVMGNASVTAAVPELNAVIDHYQQIEAQKDGKATGDPSTPGGNNNANGNDTPGTVTPSDPGTGGGTGTGSNENENENPGGGGSTGGGNDIPGGFDQG